MTHRFSWCWPALSLLFCLFLLGGCGRRDFYQPDARLTPAAPVPADDTVLATAGRHYQHGKLHNFFLGKHYRAVWAAPVRVAVLRPAQAVPGGLQFEKLGGGFQTVSATFEGKHERAYALRSLDKNPYKTLPKILQHSFVMQVVRDATAAANPYGALTVPPLAQAAGVPHTHPRLFYVRADEQALGPASARFRGKLALLEEKFDGQENLTAAFGNAKDLVDSDDMLRTRFEKQGHQIDQVAFARARLLDIWLNDWDRHQGQWQWAEYKHQGRTLYRPVPKDRDQVYFRFDDGVLPWLMSRFVPKFRTFKPAYESIKGTVRNAHFLDTRALTEVTRAQFRQLATDLQARLTDSVIAGAMHQFPAAVYALEGPRTAAILRARRAGLPAVAAKYYRMLAEEVTVAGTDEPERFEVRRLTDSTTAVSVYSRTDDPDLRGVALYQRVFRTAETKRIRLYGLRGEDEFIISGAVGRGIRIDVYGGPGADVFADSSRVAHGGRKTYYYDTKRGNEFTPGPTTADRRKRGAKMHVYDREGW